jgi:hypothetical protein
MMSGLEARLMSSLMAEERSAETDAENLGIGLCLQWNYMRRNWAEAREFFLFIIPRTKVRGN